MHEINNYITPTSPRFLDTLGHVVYDIDDLQFTIANYLYTHNSVTAVFYGEKALLFTHQTLKKLSRMCMRSSCDKLLAIYTHISVLADVCKPCKFVYKAVLDCKSRLFETFNEWMR